MALSLDFTNMMDAALPHGAGITAAQWSAAAAGFASVHARVHRMQQELGFLTLPRNDALRDATLAVAAPLRVVRALDDDLRHRMCRGAWRDLSVAAGRVWPGADGTDGRGSRGGLDGGATRDDARDGAD